MPTPQTYQQMAKDAIPHSPVWKNLLLAYLIGGAICTLGQALLMLYRSLGLDQVAAGSLESVTLIGLSALLTGLHVYDKIARYAGAGTLVPITGFANAVVSPALEFRPEGFVLGVGAKMFTIAGPVIVYGVAASVVYGVIYWALGLLS